MHLIFSAHKLVTQEKHILVAVTVKEGKIENESVCNEKKNRNSREERN
jgi:hypothetical protein